MVAAILGEVRGSVRALDPEPSPARLRFILEDAQIQVVIGHRKRWRLPERRLPESAWMLPRKIEKPVETTACVAGRPR
jgi:hypothetical protein